MRHLHRREAFAPKLKTAGSRKCDARYAQSRSLFGALRPSPRRRRGTAAAVDEVCDSPERPTLAAKPHHKRRIVLPLEGKGDRSAVDEVNMRPDPLREAS